MEDDPASEKNCVEETDYFGLETETDRERTSDTEMTENVGCTTGTGTNQIEEIGASQVKPAPKIRAINTKDVHRICSGQVIISLSTAVKELVENSIDSGATNIDIRLVDCGSKIIEVSDNGIGVDEINFAGLTRKHHTSKISAFQDLTTVATFGFRGEALSSLCAMAKLTVITKAENAKDIACKIKYDEKGEIEAKLPCARERGTTVILENIFYTLPVRQKEFLKNIKREFHKMVNVLYGYCLISKGVRINCTNQTDKGNQNKIISIPALLEMKDRIICLFGKQQVQTLLEIKPCADISDDIFGEFGLSERTFDGDKYTLEGFISVPHKGRSSSDRQFFWINNRPCEPQKVSRLVNEIYHGYSRNQYPFVCLNIHIKSEEVDVNVTPDKRKIYLQNEKILCVLLKATLLSLFSSASSDFSSPGQGMVALSQGKITTFSQNDSPSNSIFLSSPEQINESNSVEEVERFSPQCSSNSRNNRSFGSKKDNVQLKNSKLANIVEKLSRGTKRLSHSGNSYAKRLIASSLSPPLCTGARVMLPQQELPIPLKRSTNNLSKKSDIDSPMSEQESQKSTGDKMYQNSIDEDDMSANDDSPFFTSSQKENLNDPGGNECKKTANHSELQEIDIVDEPDIKYDDEFDDDFNPNKTSITVKVDWDKVKASLAERFEDENIKKSYARKFRAKISPGENQNAEDELKKQLTKDMFSHMQIVGQFNLGFIIVKLGPDLFIIDQHASDEKYNFETLEKTTVLEREVLIRPMDLQLPAVSENIIIDNLEIFRKNGFDFDISYDGQPTTRIKMTKIPVSKSVEFGKSDVDELIFMLEDCPEKSFCRPSRVRQMFASRACRKSVMIGSSMSLSEIRTLIDHMGQIDQPWNCPHGRPTIRHLLNLNILPDINSSVFNH